MNFLAIDIGASSGRHIVGSTDGGELVLKEVFRFPNGAVEKDGDLFWDIDSIVDNVKKGIDVALSEFGVIESLSVDTWGVDYVLLNGDEEIRPVYCYRSHRTEAVIPIVHEKLSFSQLYRRTGIQFQPFNSIYQIYDDMLKGRLDNATDMLMIPEYVLWKLCGTKAREYTNATTMGLVNAETGEFDAEILNTLGYPARLFPKLSQPGTVLGIYKGIKCVLCPTHDTAAAVEGIPMEGNEPFISSGTWSLLGLKTPKPITDEASEKVNYTNEGGVGYNRYLKNIMGMWLIQSLRKELCPVEDYVNIAKAASESDFDETVDVNAQEFFSPVTMKGAFDNALKTKPADSAGYFRCAYRSLAICYKKALEELSANTGRSFSALYIVGGGAKNAFLNKLTAEATGLEIRALPIEASALGNLKIQINSADK